MGNIRKGLYIMDNESKWGYEGDRRELQLKKQVLWLRHKEVVRQIKEINAILWAEQDKQEKVEV